MTNKPTLAVAQALVVVATGIALGVPVAGADPTCNSGWGWGDAAVVCHWSCSASRQITVYAEQSYELPVTGKGTCGGAAASCDGIEYCGAHGSVTAYDDHAGHCEATATIDWWRYGRVRVWCDDTHVVNAADTAALQALVRSRDDWSCPTLQVEMAPLLPAGTSLVLLQATAYTSLNADQKETHQVSGLQGTFLKANECHNFTPAVAFAPSETPKTSTVLLSIEPAAGGPQ